MGIHINEISPTYPWGFSQNSSGGGDTPSPDPPIPPTPPGPDPPVPPSEQVLYSFRINGDSSVDYLDDAEGMDAVTNSNGYVDLGEWADAFFMPKPCMLKYDGTVDYYLDSNDYTKKVDGTASDVSAANYEGNAMMEWPLIWFKYEYTDSTNLFHVANYQVDDTYHCWCNIDSENNITPHFYTSIYDCGNLYSDGVLRSLSGRTTSNANGFGNATMSNDAAYAVANNTTNAVEWYIGVYSDKILIDALLVLLCKSKNIQNILGMGLSADNKSYLENKVTGSLNDKGLFYGSTSSSTAPCKVFGMENYYGGYGQRIAGCLVTDYTKENTADTGIAKRYVKLTYGTADGSTINGYITDISSISDWENTGYIYYGSMSRLLKVGTTTDGYDISHVMAISKIVFNERGYKPSSGTVDTSSAFVSAVAYSWGVLAYAGNVYGTYGGFDSGTAYPNGGARAMGPLGFYSKSSGAISTVAARLSCKPLASRFS